MLTVVLVTAVLGLFVVAVLRSRGSALTESRPAEYYELVDKYAAMHVQMGDPLPLSTIREMVAEATRRAEPRTLGIRGPSAGLRFLHLAKESDEVRDYVAQCREDGVRGVDFEGWWSMHEYDRQMVIISDEQYAARFMVLGLQRGDAPEAVLRRLISYRGPFHVPGPAEPQGDDRHLPYEIKDRVNAWIAKRVSVPGPLIPEGTSSANAHVRQLIRKGDI